MFLRSHDVSTIFFNSLKFINVDAQIRETHAPQETTAHSPSSTPPRITVALDFACMCLWVLAAPQINDPQVHSCSYMPGGDMVHDVSQRSPALCSPHTSTPFTRWRWQIFVAV